MVLWLVSSALKNGDVLAVSRVNSMLYHSHLVGHLYVILIQAMVRGRPVSASREE